MNTKNDVTILVTNELEANKKFFESLGFEVTPMTEHQIMARFNDKIFGLITREIVDESDYRNAADFSKPLGRGIEFWLSVTDIHAHYERAKVGNLEIVSPLGNHGYGPAGDFGVRSPDGYLFFFSQPE